MKTCERASRTFHNPIGGLYTETRGWVLVEPTFMREVLETWSIDQMEKAGFNGNHFECCYQPSDGLWFFHSLVAGGWYTHVYAELGEVISYLQQNETLGLFTPEDFRN